MDIDKYLKKAYEFMAKTEKEQRKKAEKLKRILNKFKEAKKTLEREYAAEATAKGRKKKLKEDTLTRRRQKMVKAEAAGRGAQYQAVLASKGGIKPKRMVRRTFRELRAKGSVPLALQRHMKRSVGELRRDVRRARG